MRLVKTVAATEEAPIKRGKIKTENMAGMSRPLKNADP